MIDVGENPIFTKKPCIWRHLQNGHC